RRGTRSSELSNYSKITIQGFGSGDQQNKYNNENDFTVQSSSTTKYYFPYTYYSSSAYDGEYYFYNRTSMESQGYKFELLVGENKLNKKNVITYTYMDNNGIDIDAWLIKDNDVYLSNNGMNIIEETTEANAAKWMYEAATGGGYYIYTYVKTDNLDTNVKYYLNKSGTYGLTLSATKLTVWNRSSDTESSYLYTNVSGTNYYLDYMNEWRLTPYLTTYYMKYGDNYLSNNGTTLINTTSVNNATQWVVSNPTGDTTFLTVINNNIYYLSFDGSLTLGTSSYTWKKEGNGYYTTINDINVGEIRYDLIFDGSAWKTVAHSGKKLNDGNGHYLTAIKDGNNVRVDSANEANALIWQFTNNSGNTKIYTVINGNVYYLTYSNGLKMDSSGVTWTRNGNSFYFNSAGTNYYLTYDNGWTVISLQYMTISDGNGNYLKVNGSNSFSNVTTAANATHFYSNSLTNGNSTGSIYCIVGGVIYYLYNNNCVLETSDSASTTWQNDGSGNLKVNGSDIWLGYSSESASWSLSRAKTYYYIKSGTNYLTVNSNNDGITNSSGSPVDASKWIYNNSRLTSGYFSGTVKYLRINVTSSSGCTTTYSYALQYTNSNKNSAWSLNNNQLSTTTEENNKQIYLRYNSGWTYSDSSGNASNITMVSNTANAYIGIDDVSPSPSIMVVEINNNPNSIDLVELNLNYLNISTTLQQELLKTVETGLDGGYKTYFPIKLATDDEGSWYDANDPYKVSMKNTGYIIGGHRMMNSDQVDFQKASGDIRISYFPIAQIQDSYSKNALSSSTISYNGNYLILNDEKSDVSSTDDTKKAIEWVFTGSNNSYQISTKVSNKTYYLNCNVSNNNATLSIGTESNTATTWTKNNSNNFYITNGSGQNSRTYYLRYDNGWNATTSAQELTIIIGKFTTIYTVNEDGVVSLPTETAAYTEAKKQLLKTLSNSASVYGLHFMDAQISKEYLLTAPKAVILGRVYDNYEMPLDSIDFHVLERGTINFFAGDYYANNDAFFSLYKIIRGDDNNIEEILEIIEVYEKTQPNQRYIFKFKDSEGNYTFSNADGSYTGATELDTSYKSTPVFKTEWITSPNMSSMLDRTDTSNNPIGNHLYYFEIPCNEGEYCLGSVSGKTGAYLVYLDIASNGGEAINNVISAEGNSVTEAFMHVEYRDRPDKIEANDSGVIGRSLLQLAITAPDNTDLNSFSVNVKFYNHDQLVSTPSLGDYNNFTKGLYVITVVNKSSANVNLDVFLCDDDTITFNDFDYAYRVVYINTTHTTETVINTLITNYDYFKSMGSFTIPFSGDAVESTYTN
ncbi:MAG: hypothetical protein J5666_02910, partial [Bacilli bacterium]|nr:hypothetical protein [Bacilli bacterium]